MRLAAATRFEMHRVTEIPAGVGFGAVVASLMGRFVDTESLPTEGEHFGHERHSIKHASIVKGLKDLFLAPDFHPIAYAGFLLILHIPTLNNATLANQLATNPIPGNTHCL